MRGMFGRKNILFGGRGRFVWFDRWVGVSMVRIEKVYHEVVRFCVKMFRK